MRLRLSLIYVAIIATLVASAQGQDTETVCVVDGNSTTCQFTPIQLKLGTESVAQFLDTSGNRVNCNTVAINDGWYGEECNDNARDANFILHKDHKGVKKVFGSIRIGTDICRIQPNSKGTEEMTCTPEADFPERDAVDPPTDDDGEDYDAHVRSLQVGFDPKHAIGGASDAHGRMLYDDSGATIDVMVVWTRAAECLNSRLANGCTPTATTESNMRGVIDLMIQVTNAAYSLSGINTSLRLVHAYRDSTYIEPNGLLAALEELTRTSDGKLDNVHAIRTLYGADMVQLITSGYDFCGIAWISTPVPLREYMFAVVSSYCTTVTYTYAHEVGHNAGMKHDRGTEAACSADTQYNFGYRSPTAAFRSIMAYDCETGQCDNMPRNGCMEVQRFSNTQNLYNGQPIGNANNDNARVFNSNRATLASFFPAMNCQSNSQCNDNNPNTIDTCNVAKAVCVFTPGTAPTPMAAPIAPKAVPVPTPVVVPIAPKAVPAPTVPTPVVVPIAPVAMPVPTVPTPVVVVPVAPKAVPAPTVPTPVVVPIAPAPVPVPTTVVIPIAPTPVPPPVVPTPQAFPCGLFGFSIFCPITGCGLLGRLFGFCVWF